MAQVGGAVGDRGRAAEPGHGWGPVAEAGHGWGHGRGRHTEDHHGRGHGSGQGHRVGRSHGSGRSDLGVVGGPGASSDGTDRGDGRWW